MGNNQFDFTQWERIGNEVRPKNPRKLIYFDPQEAVPEELEELIIAFETFAKSNTYPLIGYTGAKTMFELEEIRLVWQFRHDKKLDWMDSSIQEDYKNVTSYGFSDYAKDNSNKETRQVAVYTPIEQEVKEEENKPKYSCNADCPDVEYGDCCHPDHCQKKLIKEEEKKGEGESRFPKHADWETPLTEKEIEEGNQMRREIQRKNLEAKSTKLSSKPSQEEKTEKGAEAQAESLFPVNSEMTSYEEYIEYSKRHGFYKGVEFGKEQFIS